MVADGSTPENIPSSAGGFPEGVLPTASRPEGPVSAEVASRPRHEGPADGEVSAPEPPSATPPIDSVVPGRSPRPVSDVTANPGEKPVDPLTPKAQQAEAAYVDGVSQK